MTEKEKGSLNKTKIPRDLTTQPTHLNQSCFSTSLSIPLLASLEAAAPAPSAAGVVFFGRVGANALRFRIRAPYFQKTTGMGTRARATNPSSELAQLTPRALNMYVAKRGKTAPAMERRKVFAAMAEAALFG